MLIDPGNAEIIPVAPLRASAAAPLAIIGAGPVGVRCARELLQRGYPGEILLFGDEPWAPYDRVRLSALLAGDTDLDGIVVPLPVSAPARLHSHLGCRIVRIEPADKYLEDAQGQRYRYSQLILATGSRAHLPSVAGIELPGVFVFRDLKDTAALLARTVRSRHCVVVGGGLLGLEAARGLQRSHTRVTLVQQAPRLMNRQLDEAAGALLRLQVEALGIEVLTGSGLAAVLGERQVTGVRLRDGREIACDTLLLATGITPNVQLALAAQLRVGRGIQVDDQLRTSQPEIFAIGECAEHRGLIYGLVAPGYEQACVLASSLSGTPAEYRGSLQATALKVAGLPVFSAGEVVDPLRRPQQRELHFRDPARGLYRKLVVQRGRLLGALAVGECQESRRWLDALEQGRPISALMLWRFRREGRLWPEDQQRVAQWPAQSTVCQCMGVSRGQLSACIAAGAGTLAGLAEQCGAGSVCGGCQPLLHNLLGDSGPRAAVGGARALAAGGLLALLLCLAFLYLPPFAAPTSVLDEGVSALWQDGLLRQLSGFGLLGLVLLGLLMSLRKRLPRLALGSFGGWRLLHVLLGAGLPLLLAAHTGLDGGDNLNRWLLLDFLLLLGLGALAALLLAGEHRLSPALARRSRRLLLWAHILAVWPWPALLAVHVLSVYYF
ncbi:nitrite reductase (NADH) large subunit [Pseudomonas benzenivorans]|nr:FAD-dependent oxidoreductase [Pseudomonas benzenivorans]SDG55956.1 nitrite reductase (NADH) large subunit [Pseudomonas benzenivorans]